MLTNGRGIIKEIKYPEAAVWDLISRSYTQEKVVKMLTYIVSCNQLEANKIVKAALETWVKDGFLLKS